MEIHLHLNFLQPVALLMPMWYVMVIYFLAFDKYNCIQCGDACKKMKPSSTIAISDSNDVMCSARVCFSLFIYPWSLLLLWKLKNTQQKASSMFTHRTQFCLLHAKMCIGKANRNVETTTMSCDHVMWSKQRLIDLQYTKEVSKH